MYSIIKICQLILVILQHMGPLALWILVFFGSLFFLILAADKFIESAEKIGKALHVDPFIIGVTVVALGTSLPELITSIIAVFQDSSEIVIGNVVGSNITNISLVMAFIAILGRRIDLMFDVSKVEAPFLIGAALITTIMMIDGSFSRFEGILCCCGLMLFLFYTMRDGGNSDLLEEIEQNIPKEETKVPLLAVLTFFLSGLVIYFSAKYNIESIIKIADILNIGSEVIALTAVALGTSLPELLVSIAAARKGNLDIAIGNLIGSNIFNCFAVLGIPSLIAPLSVPLDIIKFGLPMMIAVSLVFLIILLTKKINRWQGWMLLFFYIYFLGYLVQQTIAP